MFCDKNIIEVEEIVKIKTVHNFHDYSKHLKALLFLYT